MPFEFAFLDWLQQFHNPVLDALAVFLNYAGEHGEIWIAFTLLLLLFRRTRKAGCAMATALVLYLVAGDCILKPLFARPRPCDVNTAITILVKRPHGHSFPSGHTASAFAQPLRSGCKTGSWASPRWCWRLSSPLPGCTCMCTSPPMCWAAWRWALHWVPSPRGSLTSWQTSLRKNKAYNVKHPPLEQNGSNGRCFYLLCRPHFTVPAHHSTSL